LKIDSYIHNISNLYDIIKNSYDMTTQDKCLSKIIDLFSISENDLNKIEKFFTALVMAVDPILAILNQTIGPHNENFIIAWANSLDRTQLSNKSNNILGGNITNILYNIVLIIAFIVLIVIVIIPM